MPPSRGAVVVLGLLVVLAGCTSGIFPGDGSSAGTPTPAPETTQAAEATANGTLSVHFVNVGQSVSTLVVGPDGETMLIDSGHFTDDGEHVISYLERHGVTRIDYLVSSHADADHIGGHADIIEHFETEGDGVGAVYDPGIVSSTKTYEQYLDAVERHDVTLYETRAGDAIPMAGATVQVLSPPAGYLAGEDRNENSLVLKVTHGETAFLFTGDAEAEAEEYLVDTYGSRLRATVLKAGHHGSRSSTGAGLLAAAEPGAVVISSAYDSQYGHPHDEVLRRLSDRSIPAYWTATHGDVVLVSDGQTVTVKTQREAPTEPLDVRAGDPVEPGTTDPVQIRGQLTGGDLVEQTPVLTSDGTTDQPDGAQNLVVTTVHADAEGPDGENLNDEYVVFSNEGETTLNLGGWSVTDEAGHTYVVPEGVTLAPGESVTLRTGAGTNTETELYWDASGPVWNNDGDTVTVYDDAGRTVLTEAYS